MHQMPDMSAFSPRDPKTLTKKKKLGALQSILFVKEKRDKSLNTRAYIIRSPQQEYIPREDTALPTAAIDSLFITGAIDAYEG